jgi:hypothetical protein
MVFLTRAPSEVRNYSFGYRALVNVRDVESGALFELCLGIAKHAEERRVGGDVSAVHVRERYAGSRRFKQPTPTLFAGVERLLGAFALADVAANDPGIGGLPGFGIALCPSNA